MFYCSTYLVTEDRNTFEERLMLQQTAVRRVVLLSTSCLVQGY